MNIKELPKLPHSLKANMVYYAGDKIFIVTEDERCVYEFIWDGFSVSYNDSHIYLKVELDA